MQSSKNISHHFEVDLIGLRHIVGGPYPTLNGK